ncbi:hypothetical protein ROE7235_02325 [Roseibaca ekhonensis]|uniref:Uncharacterized protein n=1 Tax=Roseinatronobacter ekhonensis TaxID=254356 RepID=A0A3B0MUT3_9RHOB|nr:hypothetical protein [Roseibaca ekhonensis]SUZ32564.1 hypothetical protein ROE7235_02325 [Roseibaca ekhonensis]
MRPVATTISLLIGLGGTPVLADARTDMAQAVSICLENVLSKEQALDDLRAAGFELRYTDEGSYNFEKGSVSGFVTPIELTQWCWVETTDLSLTEAQDIGPAQLRAVYPNSFAGPVNRDLLANGCPGLEFMVGSRIMIMEFRNVGFHFGCNADGSAGILQ